MLQQNQESVQTFGDLSISTIDLNHLSTIVKVQAYLLFEVMCGQWILLFMPPKIYYVYNVLKQKGAKISTRKVGFCLICSNSVLQQFMSIPIKQFKWLLKSKSLGHPCNDYHKHHNSHAMFGRPTNLLIEGEVETLS